MQIILCCIGSLKLRLFSFLGELVIRDNVIRFEGVPLVTPNGDVLIDSLDFEVDLLCFLFIYANNYTENGTDQSTC